MSQETKNKNEQPKDEAVSEQVPEKELPAEEPKENAENAQEADLGAVRPHAVHGLRGDIDVSHQCTLCSSAMASSSPSREEVRTSSE